MKKTAIIYLLYGDEPKKYLSRALDGIAVQSYPRQDLSLVIVYNPAPEVNQLDIIRTVVAAAAAELPVVTILGQANNIGFSAGNNTGMRAAVADGAEYIFLHNGDGYLHPRAIENLVKKMTADEKIGQAQAMILLSDRPEIINSSGNRWHYLGIGYCGDYGRELRDYKTGYPEIGYASGAATILRADLLKEFGYWREDFFLYHEDTEYSLRLRLAGYKIVVAADAYFYHDYAFSKNKKKFYWLERNRHAVKLIYYRLPTLLLLLPLELVYNLGLLIYATLTGWGGELLRVYDYWSRPKNWRGWLNYRREIQNNRQVPDRFLLRRAAVRVTTGVIKNPLVLWPMNAVFTIYGFLLKMVVRW